MWHLAEKEAFFELSSFEPEKIHQYADLRFEHYRDEFAKISNVTVVTADKLWEHGFKNKSYQTVVGKIITQYRRGQNRAQESGSTS